MRSLLLGSLAMLVTTPALAVDITTCGQNVPDREVGVLQADISCGGAFVGVMLGSRSTLEMNGHRITDGSPYGVQCLVGICRVVGPGEIAGSAATAQSAGVGGDAKRVFLSDLDLHDNHTGASFFQRGRERVTATNVTAHDNQFGIAAARLKATNVSATHNAIVGLSILRTVTGSQVVTSENGAPQSISAGIVGGSVRLDGLVARDNLGEGIFAHSVRLSSSTVLDNNGFGRGIDIASELRPRLTLTTCGRSQKIGDFGLESWGVCMND